MRIEVQVDPLTRKGTVTTHLGGGKTEVLRIKGLNIAQKQSMTYDRGEGGAVSNLRKNGPVELELTMVEDEDADPGEEGTTEAAD